MWTVSWDFIELVLAWPYKRAWQTITSNAVHLGRLGADDLGVVLALHGCCSQLCDIPPGGSGCGLGPGGCSAVGSAARGVWWKRLHQVSKPAISLHYSVIITFSLSSHNTPPQCMLCRLSSLLRDWFIIDYWLDCIVYISLWIPSPIWGLTVLFYLLWAYHCAANTLLLLLFDLISFVFYPGLLKRILHNSNMSNSSTELFTEGKFSYHVLTPTHKVTHCTIG